MCEMDITQWIIQQIRFRHLKGERLFPYDFLEYLVASDIFTEDSDIV